jgi:hypothetical protein
VTVLGALTFGDTDCEWSVVWCLLFLLRVVVLRIAVSVVYRTSTIDKLNRTINLKTVHFAGQCCTVL